MTDHQMDDDKNFDALMRDAAETYRRPPQISLDEMWVGIEAQLPSVHSLESAPVQQPLAGRPARFRTQNWIAIAATLLIGIGIGRLTLHTTQPQAPVTTVAAVTPAAGTTRMDIAASSPYEAETSRYLGQTAALLIALPTEEKSGKTDEQFITRAGDLLTTTRMLMDSPAANDPSMRNLLEDLELVLAQVVRLPNEHNRTELDLINRALQQRDVIPRLRTAVADISAD